MRMLNVSLHLFFATLKSAWPSLLASLVCRMTVETCHPLYLVVVKVYRIKESGPIQIF